MKSYVLRFRWEDKNNFDEIKRGDKWVETRTATDRYTKIKAKDKLIFVCDKLKLEKEISKVSIHKSIPALFKKYKIQDIMPSLNNLAEVKRAYYDYPGYKEKIKKFGIIAFELK